MIKAVVLLGCGNKLPTLMGALQCTIDRGTTDLEAVKFFVGTSSGSIGCLMLCAGVSPTAIIAFINQNKLLIKKFDSRFNIFELLQLKSLDLSEYTTLIRAHVSRQLGINPDEPLTMKRLFELTQKTLVVCVYNYTRRRAEYVSHTTHPDFDVYQTVTASCSIPFVSVPCRIGTDLYVDGGFYDSFPIYVPRKYGVPPHQTLGIYISYHNAFPEMLMDDGCTYKTFDDQPHQFVKDLFYVIMFSGRMVAAEQAALVSLIIDCKIGADTDCGSTKSIMDTAFTGYESAAAVLDARSSRRNRRRRRRSTRRT